MLTQLGSGNDDLSGADAIIWQEDNFEEINNVVVRINEHTHAVYHLNNHLGVVISWRCLSTNHDHARDKLIFSFCGGSIFDFEISVNAVKQIEELTLVLVNSLNLHVIE